MPEDVVDDLKQIPPQLGFSGYHSLMTVYIGQGLREDLERRDDDEKMSLFIESLPKQGVGDGVIASVMAEFNEVH